MAITLIGRGSEPFSLPEADLDFPFPAQEPEATPLWSIERLLELVEDPSPISRRFALRRLGRSKDPRAIEAFIQRVADASPEVQVGTIQHAEQQNMKVAAPAIEKQFREATNQFVRQTAAEALGRVGPERVLEILRGAPRLQDEEYASFVMSLGASWPEGTSAYVDRSMNRAGVLPPQRRTALYAAAILGPDASLAHRVVGMAVAESRDEKTFDGPARLAVGTLTPALELVRSTGGGERLYKILRDAPRSGWPEDKAERIEDALRAGKVGDAILVISEVTGLEARPFEVIPRPEGLLTALVNHAKVINELPPTNAAIFLAAATAVEVRVRAGTLAEAARKALVEALGDGDLASMAAKAKEHANRESLLPHLRALTSFGDRGDFASRAVLALTKAEPQLILDEAARNQEGPISELLHFSAEEVAKELEPWVTDKITNRSTSDDDLFVALHLGGAIATRRTTAAIGRRFYELRKRSRAELLGAVELSGDVRMFPAVASRAFEDEMEEPIALGLAELGKIKVEGALANARARWFDGAGQEPDGFLMEFRCMRCSEALAYRTSRVFIDPENPDKKPAFAGDRKCKACGAGPDNLQLTELGQRALRALIVESMSLEPSDGLPPAVPMKIRMGTKKVPISQALEELDTDIARSPTAIRPRLKRARILLLLERSAAIDDINAVLEVDKGAPEALTALAELRMRQGRPDEAANLLATALTSVRNETGRLYERESNELQAIVETLLLDLEGHGIEIPDSVDLEAARRHRTRMAEERAMQREEEE